MFKKGDKVRIKSREEIISDGIGVSRNPAWNDRMSNFCGKEYMVEEIITDTGWMKLKNVRSTYNNWMWHPAWVDKVHEIPEELQILLDERLFEI